MRLYIKPKKLEGELQIPASKSYAHRYLIASALSDDPTEITGRLTGRDVEATVSCLKVLGAKFEKINDNKLLVFPIKELPSNSIKLNVLESGSTLRFLIPLISALGVNGNFTGEGRLLERPIGELISELENHGITASDKKLPFCINGSLTGGNYIINGEISSQYITGLLMSLPILKEDSTLTVTGDIASSSYIDITLSVLKEFGIEIYKNENVFSIKGNQRYRSPKKVTVESDWSNACFFIVGGVLAGDIVLKGLNELSLQGDRVAVELLKDAGANINYKKDGLYIQKSSLKCLNFSANNCPDIVPAMAVALANAKGISRIYDVDRLKIKECDRLNATIEMLMKFGINSEYEKNTLIIYGGKMKGNIINPYNDHRMAMSAAIAGLIATGITVIDDTKCVNKSYPAFFEDYKGLGGDVNVADI